MVDTTTTLLVCVRKPATRHAKKMNLRKVENSELLTTLLRLDDKKNPLLPVEAEVFFLTSPFIERGNRPCGISS